jgi:hypothetical protein
VVQADVAQADVRYANLVVKPRLCAADLAAPNTALHDMWTGTCLVHLLAGGNCATSEATRSAWSKGLVAQRACRLTRRASLVVQVGRVCWVGHVQSPGRGVGRVHSLGHMVGRVQSLGRKVGCVHSLGRKVGCVQSLGCRVECVQSLGRRVECVQSLGRKVGRVQSLGRKVGRVQMLVGEALDPQTRLSAHDAGTK